MPGHRPPRVLVIAGPTASGKSAAALHLAEALGGEVVSADSVQVYRGFDIGSAKPSTAERARVPHHLLDVLAPEESWDAMMFARAADGALADIGARGRVPIVAGGTGLWLRALLRGLVPLPPVDPVVRAALEARATNEGTAALHAELAAVDPDAAAKIHPNDALRIVRALEVHAQTGEPLGALRKAHALGTPRLDAWVMVLDRAPVTGADPIAERFSAMLAAGLVEEVRALLDAHGPDVRPFGSVGYRQVRDHLLGHGTLEDAAREAIRATRVYARRQRTWLRSEPGIDARMDGGALDAAYVATLRRWLDGGPRPA